jgi:hypothetical protein
MCVLSGQRLVFPSWADVQKHVQHAKIYQEIDSTDKNPKAIAAVARKWGKTEKSATEIFDKMTRVLDVNVSGEYPVYDNPLV